MRRAIAIAASIALTTTACARPSSLTYPTGIPAGPTDDRVVEDVDAVAAQAFSDLETYWSRVMPTVYREGFTPLDGGARPFDSDGPVPSCGPQKLTYEDVAENALYCTFDDYVAWDAEALLPDLQRRFGRVTTGLVLAHEYAHAVQQRAGVEATTIVLELQADCFAGAWLADADGRLATFATVGGALDAALAGLLELRDSLGVDAADGDAHGAGFDRVGAFQDGFERGPEMCSAYETGPPEVVAMPFGSAADFRNEGNLPIAALIDPLTTDLDAFFSAYVTDRAGAWAAPAVDIGAIDPGLAEIGDFAVAAQIAHAYARSAQEALGMTDGDRGAGSLGVHADCLTGAFARAEFDLAVPDQQLELSPGDLDEIVIVFVSANDTDDDAFARTAALRSGFRGGTDACDDLLD